MRPSDLKFDMPRQLHVYVRCKQKHMKDIEDLCWTCLESSLAGGLQNVLPVAKTSIDVEACVRSILVLETLFLCAFSLIEPS